MKASWPPKKPESYFRTLRRLLDLLVCWGGGEGERRGGKKSGRNYMIFKRYENQAFALETISNSDYALYVYDSLYIYVYMCI